MPRRSKQHKHLALLNHARINKPSIPECIEEDINDYNELSSEDEGSFIAECLEDLDDEKTRSTIERKFTEAPDLRWEDGADDHIKKPNRHGDGSSRRSTARKKVKHTEDDTRWTDYFTLDENQQPPLIPVNVVKTRGKYSWSRYNLRRLIKETETVTTNISNRKSHLQNPLDERKKIKLLSARLLMKKVIDEEFKQDAAAAIARNTFDKKGESALYCGKHIISWVDQLIRCGDLDDPSKGCHRKTESLILDEDI
jgi:hypothetical protein